MQKIIVVLAVMTTMFITASTAQPIDIFGFFQSKFTYTPSGPLEKEKSTFNLQQMNLIMRKDLGQSFSAFINLQMTNSFNTEHAWGAINIEEAWMNYTICDGVSIKGGLLVPVFNNLNEIKNKTPLLPYIARPVVYESSLSQLVPIGKFVPERAFVQIYGTQPLAGVRLDYAAYVGNSEPAYLLGATTAATTAVGGTSVTGNDTTTFKLVGGRVGIRAGSIKAGISGTYDHEKVEQNLGVMTLFVGNVPRVRVGGDLSFKIGDFSFEGEVISCSYSINDQSKALLDGLVFMTTDPRTGTSAFQRSLDKKFYYVNLMYDITDKWFVYGGESYLQDNSTTYYKDGIIIPSFGGGFRPMDDVVIKAQYEYVEGKNKDVTTIKSSNYNLAVSVTF